MLLLTHNCFSGTRYRKDFPIFRSFSVLHMKIFLLYLEPEPVIFCLLMRKIFQCQEIFLQYPIIFSVLFSSTEGFSSNLNWKSLPLITQYFSHSLKLEMLLQRPVPRSAYYAGKPASSVNKTRACIASSDFFTPQKFPNNFWSLVEKFHFRKK